MSHQNIGFLHPGEMGVSLAASALSSGYHAFWVSADRSEKTRERAELYGLRELNSLEELSSTCSVIIAICPPKNAEKLAQQVVGANFQGYYVDANAISPQRSQSIGKTLKMAGIRYIDGGIIGGPAWQAGKTCLYLSGENTSIITNCFSSGLLEVKTLGTEIGKASALKICYASYRKGRAALLAATLAAAEQFDVLDELDAHWSSQDEVPHQGINDINRAASKAWRFCGEMDEIADSLGKAGSNPHFHHAAREIYQSLSHFKYVDQQPSLKKILAAILR